MKNIPSTTNDINVYIDRCKKYNESVKLDKNGQPACYGKHAKKLKKREIHDKWVGQMMSIYKKEQERFKKEQLKRFQNKHEEDVNYE